MCVMNDVCECDVICEYDVLCVMMLWRPSRARPGATAVCFQTPPSVVLGGPVRGSIGSTRSADVTPDW